MKQLISSILVDLCPDLIIGNQNSSHTQQIIIKSASRLIQWLNAMKILLTSQEITSK